MKSKDTDEYYGFTLCLAGSVTRLIVGRIVTHQAGVLMLLSPAVPMVELQHSDDYKEITITERKERLSSLVLPHIPQLIKKGYLQDPYLSLSSTSQEKFMSMAEDISRAEERVKIAELEQLDIINQIVTLKKCELIMEMLLEMTQTKSTEKVVYSRREATVASFLQLLSTNYNMHRTVAYYSQQACLTPRYFSKLVKEQTGLTAMDWIVQITIAHAKNFLVESDIQIKTLAQELGFSEQFTFRKYFKKYTGFSPTAYRRFFQKNPRF